MPFKRIATLDIKSVYATDTNGKFQWRSFVKQANDNPSQDRSEFLPKDAYKYDTDHFLFLTARAISGMEKWGHNGNYDAFPWEEIKKAIPTYPGCGFYIEHKEDSEEDAKGIVLDVFPNEEEQYLVCLCAIDKEESPDLCEKILDGTYNQVSMSCLANECECSECHNVAHSFEELCQHMNPNMPITYMKGKKNDKGEDIYEINRDICFSGLSAVAVPADKDAFVFDIKAAKKKDNKLKEEVAKYQAIKQAAKMKEFKTACEEQFKSMDTFTLLNKLQNCATAITNQIADCGSDTSILTAPLQGILRQLMELQIGLTVLDLNKLSQPKEDATEETVKPILEEHEMSELPDEIVEEVNLDKEIDSMLKTVKSKEIVLTDEQKQYLLDNLFADGSAYDDYSKAINKPWKITTDRSMDSWAQDKDGFPYSLLIDNHFADAISKNLVTKLTDMNQTVNLDKEIDSYLSGDNYSYTPFSSTASKGRNIKYFDNTTDMLKWLQQNKDSIQNVTIEMNCYGDSCAKATYEPIKEIKSSLDKIIEKTYK